VVRPYIDKELEHRTVSRLLGYRGTVLLDLDRTREHDAQTLVKVRSVVVDDVA
jgi:hypothetical protein